MAIFWRALDPRSYKYNGDDGKQYLFSEEECRDGFPFPPEHRRIMKASRKAAADALLYQSYLGWEHIHEGEVDLACGWNRRPTKIPALGVNTVEDSLDWIPIRLRSSFARILHFALALIIERLLLDDLFLQVPVSYLKYWLVKDTEEFLGNHLSVCLSTWIDEVVERTEAGERSEQFTSLDTADREFITKSEGQWRPTALTKTCRSMYSTRARLVSSGNPFSMHVHTSVDSDYEVSWTNALVSLRD